MNTREYFTRLNNVFHGVIALPLLVFVYLYLEMDEGSLQPIAPEAESTVFLVLFLVLSTAIFTWAFISYGRTNRALSSSQVTLIDRLRAYSKTSLNFYVLMSVPGALAIVGILVTGDLALSVVYIVGLFLLSVKRPSVHTIVKDLGLKDDERKLILKKDDIKPIG